jgi:phage terminase small subunit
MNNDNLTGKQKAFADYLLANPTKPKADAVIQAGYKIAKRGTASQVAHENLKKPEIMLYLAKHSDTASNTVLEVLNHSKQQMYSDDKRGVDWGNLAEKTANSILDRVHGKARQQIEVQSTHVSITLDLTGGAYDDTTSIE